MTHKRRGPINPSRGEHRWSAKLTNAAVREIIFVLALIEAGWSTTSQASVARAYGVRPPVVTWIKHGRRWRCAYDAA